MIILKLLLFFSNNIYFILLYITAIGITLNISNGSKIYPDKGVGGPYQFIPHLTAYLPEYASYYELQMQLENIADENRLYDLSTEDRDKSVKELMADPKVQKIVKQCSEFYNKPSCSSSPYRTIDGRCNNLKNPGWASTKHEQIRLLPAYYEGASEFRRALSGKTLPNARKISLKLKTLEPLNQRLSSLFVFFGQVVTHDVVLTPRLYEDDTEHVCSEEKYLRYQIFYDEDDPFYSQFHVRCGSFFRSAPMPKCNFEKRTIMNLMTSFVDSSEIYGFDDNKSISLRKMDGSGKLQTQKTNVGELLPQYKDEDIFCSKNSAYVCFNAGDDKGNQHTSLSVLINILTKFHNVIADELHMLNPTWDEEKLFQESRRISIAVLQLVTYKEYLSLLVSPETVKKYDLNVDSSSQYDSTINAAQLLEFSTAAFRLHPMVPHIVTQYDSLAMNQTFSFMDPLYQGASDEILSGSMEIACNRYSSEVIDDLKDMLYKPPGAVFGLDLASTNIQRGRDHGIPPYVIVAQYCNENLKINNFEDLIKIMSQKNVNLMKSIYKNVADIDLWVGMISETPLPNGEIGPTASCVVGEQFYRIKFGDSYFFTHTNSRNPFTEVQLRVIRSFSLPRIFCLTTNLRQVRKKPMEMPSRINNLVPCQQYPSINLTAWKE